MPPKRRQFEVLSFPVDPVANTGIFTGVFNAIEASSVVPPISLLPVLWRIADQWVAVTGTNHSTLGNRALFSSGVFERLRAGKTITQQNYERLLNWLAQPANWPDAEVPQECRVLLHDMASIGQSAQMSPGSAEKVSPDDHGVDPVVGGPFSRRAAEGVAHAITATPEAAQGREVGA